MTAALTAVVLTMAGTACGAADVTDPTAEPQPSTEPTSTGTARGSGQPSDGQTADDTDTEEPMRIRITIDDQRFTATLEDSAAAEYLLGQLPVTVDMTDHGGVEKTGALPSPLSLDGQPEGADPDPGDVGYYAPGKDLVRYYGNQSYFPGIVVLGRLDGAAAPRIAQLDGTVTATATVEAG